MEWRGFLGQWNYCMTLMVGYVPSNNCQIYRDNKGVFHAKKGIIKDWNGMESHRNEVLKRSSKNTAEVYKKILET